MVVVVVVVCACQTYMSNREESEVTEVSSFKSEERWNVENRYYIWC